MKNEGVPIVREGMPFLLFFLAVTVAFIVGGWVSLSFLFGVITCYVAFFFRNPERVPPVGSARVASPADGKIIFVGIATEHEFTQQKMQKVSIFMSLWDVHVNRAPIDGTIRDMKYRRGRFMAAFEEGASEENERNAMCFETAGGEKVIVVQVAGLVARRIVSYPTPGAFMLKGQRIGLIRFGSRCDLYLPLSSKVAVSMGEKVVGGETIIAELKEGTT